MSTSCNIAVEQEDGSWAQASISSDGYPEHMMIQLGAWNTQEAAEYLCDLGTLSSIVNTFPNVVDSLKYNAEYLTTPVKRQQYLYIHKYGGSWMQVDDKLNEIPRKVY